MSDTKFAFTWADLLLILVLSTVGAGVCGLSARIAERTPASRAPREAAFQDSAGLPPLEQALSAAGDERAAVATQLRELRFRQMRDSAALSLLDTDLEALRSARPAASPASLDTLEHERTRLQRALRADSSLAVRMGDAAKAMGDTVNARRRAVADARSKAGGLYRDAQRRFALEQAGATAGGTIVVIAVLLGIATVMLRPPKIGTPLVQRGRDIGISAVLISLFLAYQLLGGPVTLLLAAVIALFALLPNLHHVS
jgi:hypothetical protein